MGVHRLNSLHMDNADIGYIHIQHLRVNKEALHLQSIASTELGTLYFMQCTIL